MSKSDSTPSQNLRACRKCACFFDVKNCPFCAKARVAEYRKKHPEKVKAAIQLWGIKNKDKVSAYRKEYALENKEKIRIKIKEHYEKNKPKYISKASEWKAKNQDASKLSQKKSNEKRKASGAIKAYRESNKDRIYSATKKWKEENSERVKKRAKEYRLENREKILALDKHKNTIRYRLIGSQQLARYYANEIREIYLQCPSGSHVDHIIPLKSKIVCGLHIPINLQYLPANQNLKKGNKFTPDLFEAKYGTQAELLNLTLERVGQS